ncbi:pilus assembly protein PilP [Halomonas sp. LC1]|uniref:pilus assembly protein PilP n=1 Tax=Halomonas sp. LC1 TaxID=3043733 RepID=UPI002556319D|nr:pilus assembly protein PilP [Halomonas sp. LC1]MDK9688217.1 pilus assembly protein PilP [Halomonas sp. LC1]
MRRLFSIGMVALLAGCGDANLSQLESVMEEIRRAPTGQPPVIIPTIPEYQPVDYRYSDTRSPFLAPESVRATDVVAVFDSALAPDQQRKAEPLEQFPLQSLRLVGTLRMGGQQVALISAPDGSVTSVREGNYLGTDYGQVTDIRPQEVHITERILNQQVGWQERQATLSLDE